MPQKISKAHQHNPRRLRSVALLRFSAIGDVAMTVPAVYSACHTYPDVRFIFVTRKSMTSIFVNPPANLSLVGVDLKTEFKGLCGMRRLFGILRDRYAIDGVVDLHDVIRTKYLRLLARLRMIPTSVIHKGRKGKRALTRSRDKVMLPLMSSRKRYRDAFARIGLPIVADFDGLYGKSPAPPADYAAISSPPSPGINWVGIAPFAKHKGKIYPTELMEQVISELSARPDITLFLFGGGETEQKILADWAARYPHVISLASAHHGFSAELALISNFSCMVSMDSANMHLASLVSIPVVSVWGATHPFCGFKGWHQSDDNIIHLPLTCRPCSVFGDKPCRRGDYFCLAGIKPKTIIDHVCALLPPLSDNS